MTNAASETAKTIIPQEIVEATIEHFTRLDSTGDKRSMGKIARRLGKEQPALLRHAASFKDEHGEAAGEAAVFYCTLVWSIFDRQFPHRLDRLTPENIAAAQAVVDEELGKVPDLAAQPVARRYSPELAARQPHILAKLEELISQDVAKEAMTAECAEAIFPPTQVMVEAFDACIAGRRRGERQGTVVRETAKVGRNEPCPCGSGKKYKKCHGGAES